MHESLQYKPRDELVIGDETNCVFVKLGKKSLNIDRNIIVGLLYRPPISSIQAFTHALQPLLVKITPEIKYIYLMGDYNINTLKNIPTNVNTSEFNNLMSEHLVYPMINKPTRVIAHTASIIDNIYTNTMTPTNTGILSYVISDHFLIFCIFNDLPISADKPTITKRRLNKESIKKLNKALQFIDRHFIYIYVECTFK